MKVSVAVLKQLRGLTGYRVVVGSCQVLAVFALGLFVEGLCWR
ncbi:MAG: hypothetical protein ACKESB_02525 [Candidatus Hodgkinia cicadicola]